MSDMPRNFGGRTVPLPAVHTVDALPLLGACVIAAGASSGLWAHSSRVAKQAVDLYEMLGKEIQGRYDAKFDTKESK